MNDPVNKPNHYRQGTIEVVDAILGLKLPYLEGNILKYLARWKFKGKTLELKKQDLLKARYYLNLLIANSDDELARNNNVPD
ncbi:MAG: DUF3310 domain-containing protein [Opitutae bacterium]